MPLSPSRKTVIPAGSRPSVRMLTIDEASAGQRVDNFLLRVCKGVPKSHIYKAIRGGEVRVNKGRIQADYRLASGDVIRVPPLRLPAPDERRVPPGSFPVVFEDDVIVVI